MAIAVPYKLSDKRMIDGVGGKISSTSRRSRIPFNRVSRDFP